jgi:branched-chain amino acid transport system ATP-binding protein
VEAGEIVTLLGSNGAGKSTLLKAVSGILRPKKGSIYIDGARVDRIPSHEIVRKRIAHVPEGRQLFPNMTVYENLLVGAYVPVAWGERYKNIEEVFTLFPILKQRKNQLAGTLSGGEQQMLTIGRGLMIEPKMLMLDEISLGLAPILVEQIFGVLEEINRQGVTILLIEQNANIALQMAQRGYILETGVIKFSGKADELLENEHVKKAYLGTGEEIE